MFSSLPLRERLIVKFALRAGMRPGEIFALKVPDVLHGYADIQRAVYRGVVDTPKTDTSIRKAAVPESLMEDLRVWLGFVPQEGWLFPSEKKTPLSKDNVWGRNIRPKLKEVGLRWVNFQTLRTTHSTLMGEMEIDPRIVADQQGHTVDMNQNVYRRVPLEQKQAAVTALDSVLIH